AEDVSVEDVVGVVGRLGGEPRVAQSPEKQIQGEMTTREGSADLIDRKTRMARAAGENDARRRQRDDLRSLHAGRAVCEGDCAIHRYPCRRAKASAVPHQEVRLHPAVATCRYRSRW